MQSFLSITKILLQQLQEMFLFDQNTFFIAKNDDF